MSEWNIAAAVCLALIIFFFFAGYRVLYYSAPDTEGDFEKACHALKKDAIVLHTWHKGSFCIKPDGIIPMQ